mmetsp:Transcript_76761/g.135552  ORF Transcript_76761/g.135552 Transcript_76761/m.135552 type:complete len:683 (-) Transcript_76761:2763-4811(-)
MPPSAKFRAQFIHNQTAEWAEQYVEYDALLDLIQAELRNGDPNYSFRVRFSSFGGASRTRGVSGNNSSGGSKRSSLRDSLSITQPLLGMNLDEVYPMAEGSFSHALHNQMDKVSAFVEKNMQQCQTRLADITEYSNSTGHNPAVLRKALVQVCRQYMLLGNFCTINAAAVFELAERRSTVFYRLLSDKLEAAPPTFMAAGEETIPESISLITEMHADFFYNGDVGVAQSDLEAHRQKQPMKFWEVFSLGMFLGLSIPLAILIVFAAAYSPLLSPGFDWDRLLLVVPVLRAGLCLNITNWLWALAVVVMEKNRINFNFVLDLDPASSLSSHHIFRMAAFGSFHWLLFLMLYVATLEGEITINQTPPEYWLRMYVFTWLLLHVCPWTLAGPRKTRWWIAKGILGVIIAPFQEVTFATNFIGDYLTSTVKVLIDIQMISCWVLAPYGITEYGTCSTNHHWHFALIFLPLYWRMMQCLRRFYDTADRAHLVNFGKYGVSMLAACAGRIWPHTRMWAESYSYGHMLQASLLLSATLYSYTWDILKDWGLFVKSEDNSWAYRRMFIRYRHAIVFAAIMNLIGRCAWMYTLVVRPPGSRWQRETVSFITAVLEIYRRTQWSILRIANEHFNNVSAYRAVGSAPLTFSDGTKFTDNDRNYEDVQAFLKEKREMLKKKSMMSMRSPKKETS